MFSCGSQLFNPSWGSLCWYIYQLAFCSFTHAFRHLDVCAYTRPLARKTHGGSPNAIPAFVSVSLVLNRSSTFQLFYQPLSILAVLKQELKFVAMNAHAVTKPMLAVTYDERYASRRAACLMHQHLLKIRSTQSILLHCAPETRETEEL